MIRPRLSAPGLVLPNGSLSKALADYLIALESGDEDTATAALEALTARVVELEAIPGQIANMHGTNGVTVFGSLESGLVIQGSAGDSILAAQIFGG